MFLLLLLAAGVCSVEHHLYWNSSNPMWKESDPTLHVRMGDRIRIYCPDAARDSRTAHLKVFQVSEFSYAECMLETGKQQVVLCNGNEGNGRPRSTIITVRPYSSTPNALTFNVGQYYWISTSNGKADGLDRTLYGLCKTHQMRLQLIVSERQERQLTSSTSTPPVKYIRPQMLENEQDVEPALKAIENIPGDMNEEQLKAVLSLASQGKTGTFRHNNVVVDPQIEDHQGWNPMNYYKSYYKQDAPYEPVIAPSSEVKDYEIGEDTSIGRSYPSYLSSSSVSRWLLFPLVLYLL